MDHTLHFEAPAQAHAPVGAGRGRFGLLLAYHNVDVRRAVDSAGPLMAFAVETCVLCRNADRCEDMLVAGRDVRTFCPNAGVLEHLPKRWVH